MNKISSNNRLFRFVVTFFFLFALFIPSIKFFVFSGVVNFLVMMVLICLMIISLIQGGHVRKNNCIIGVLYSSLFLFILFSGLFPSAILDSKTISKFIFIILLIQAIVILFEYIDIKLFVSLTIFTSTILVLLNKLNVIHATGSGELSYLILSMQVSIGVGALIGRYFFSSRYKKVYLALLLFNLYGVLTLAGRSSIAGVGFMLIIGFSLYSIMNYKANRGKILLSCGAVFLLSSYVINFLLKNIFNAFFLHKMEMLLNGEGDSRFSTYLKAIEIITNNPLGLGLNGYESTLLFYPHNILLEISLNIGLLGGVYFSFLLFLFAFYYYKKVKNTKVILVNELSLWLMSISLLISWSTSNSLSSSYSLFMCLILSTCFSLRMQKTVIQ
jgi:hypothetical protein